MHIFSRIFTWGFFLATLALSGAACDEGDPIVIPPTTGEIGPEGGEVVAGDASITVPPGALDEPRVISMAQAQGTTTIEDYLLVGPLIEISPSGTVFAVPATVTVPYDRSALPQGAEEDEIVIFTAEEVDGDFAPLASVVDSARSTVSAEVSHLSIFVPAVRAPAVVPDPFAPCPMHGECDCSVRDSRPLDLTGSATLDRIIHAMCINDEGELRVTSYTLLEDTLTVDEVYDTRLDAVSLDVLDEQLVDLQLQSSELCQPADRHFLADGQGDTSWAVRYVEHEDSDTLERWTEALLTVSDPQGEITYSFNRHLNTESPYLDTYFFWDDSNTLAGQVRSDGSASFYLNNHHEGHVDYLLVGHLAEVLRSPAGHLDEEGYGIPDVRDRYELWDDPSSARGDTYSFRSLFLSVSPDNADIDLLTVFGTGPSLIRGFEVDGRGTFIERPELGLDPFWSQFGWHNAGLYADVLHLQSQVASFSNSVLLELDPVAWTVARQWEIGCIGPPSLHGFQLLDEGMLLRFAYDATQDGVSRVMFIRDGGVLAIGEVPFITVNPTFLLHPDHTMVYTAHVQTGELTAIAIP